MKNVKKAIALVAVIMEFLQLHLLRTVFLYVQVVTSQLEHSDRVKTLAKLP